MVQGAGTWSDDPTQRGAPTAPVLLAWVLAAAGAAVGIAALVVMLRSGGDVSWKPALLPVLWGVPGALIAAGRPRSPVGWLVLAVALVFAGSALAEAVTRSTDSAWAVWYVDRFAAVLVPCMFLALLLLPDGRLPSPVWRLPVGVLLAAQGLLVAAWMLVSGPAAAPDSDWPPELASLPNPVGVLPSAWAGPLADLEWLLQLPLLLCLVAVVVRLRRADPVERVRIASLLLGVAVFVVAVVLGRAVWPPLADILDVFAAAFLAVVLVAAVLRRRLSDVAVVVHHTVVYAVLVLLVAGGYVVAVGLLTAAGATLSPFGAGVVAAAAALAVLPLRTLLQRFVDWLMHGDRRDPYAALTRLAAQAHRALTPTEVLAAVAESVSASLRSPWVRASAYGLTATHGNRAGGTVTPGRLVSGDAVIGTLEVGTTAGRRLRADEIALLTELGRHAGMAVEAAHLAQQAAEHQQRLVTAREEERRRLGRELHDGLGPSIAGLAMQLGALRALVHTSPDVVVERLDALHRAAGQALVDIRRVAHALRPPVLDQLGLEGALRQLADSLGLRAQVTVESSALPAAVELAAYRICAEALTNVSRHAGGAVVVVRLWIEDEALLLSVTDDGQGVAPGARAGLGIENMRERAGELGGRLVVGPGLDGGTVVSAVLPTRLAGSDLDELAR